MRHLKSCILAAALPGAAQPADGDTARMRTGRTRTQWLHAGEVDVRTISSRSAGSRLRSGSCRSVCQLRAVARGIDQITTDVTESVSLVK